MSLRAEQSKIENIFIRLCVIQKFHVHLQNVNQSHDTLKMNELANLVYILKVFLDNKNVIIRKIVKQ